MIIVSDNKYVHVFKFNSDLNKNTNKINIKKRGIELTWDGTFAGGIGCAIINWTSHTDRLTLFEVVVLSRCKKMFAV